MKTPPGVRRVLCDHLSVNTHSVPVLQRMLSWLCNCPSTVVFKSTNTAGCGVCIVSLHWCDSAVDELGWQRTLIASDIGKSYVSNRSWLYSYPLLMFQHICKVFCVSVCPLPVSGWGSISCIFIYCLCCQKYSKPVTQLPSLLTAKCYSSSPHFLFPFCQMLIANISTFRITQCAFVQD